MSKEIAKALLDIEAVFLSPNQPFTWASGIKSPIYCDNRLILSDVISRDLVETSMVKMILKEYENVDYIVGTATAGIAHAAIIAHILQKPMAYVRSSAKEHGRSNLIEGDIKPGSRVVVIEDLISTGGSSLKCVDALKEHGCVVLGVAAIFSYLMPKSFENFEKAGIQLNTLTNLDTLLDVALSNETISEKEFAMIKQFRDNPSDGSWME